MDAVKLLKKDPSKLSDILKIYEEDLMDYATNLTVAGKTLEYALREQATWSAFYGDRKVELKTIYNYFDVQISRVRGHLYSNYNENYSRQLGDRAIDKYIDREPEYLEMYAAQAEVKELLEKYENVLDAFTKRGFALRDITLARVNAVNDSTL